jgi:hypothetical protein
MADMTKAQHDQFQKLSVKMIEAAAKKPNARTRGDVRVEQMMPGQFMGTEYQRSGTVRVGECEYTILIAAARKEK